MGIILEPHDSIHTPDCTLQVLKKTKFAPGIFTKEEMDRKWEGYDKDAVVWLGEAWHKLNTMACFVIRKEEHD